MFFYSEILIQSSSVPKDPAPSSSSSSSSSSTSSSADFVASSYSSSSSSSSSSSIPLTTHAEDEQRRLRRMNRPRYKRHLWCSDFPCNNPFRFVRFAPIGRDNTRHDRRSQRCEIDGQFGSLSFTMKTANASSRANFPKSRSEADSISDAIDLSDHTPDSASSVTPPVSSPSPVVTKPPKKGEGRAMDLSLSPVKLTLDEDRLDAPRKSNRGSRRGSAPAIFYKDVL